MARKQNRICNRNVNMYSLRELFNSLALLLKPMHWTWTLCLNYNIHSWNSILNWTFYLLTKVLTNGNHKTVFLFNYSTALHYTASNWTKINRITRHDHPISNSSVILFKIHLRNSFWIFFFSKTSRNKSINAMLQIHHSRRFCTFMRFSPSIMKSIVNVQLHLQNNNKYTRKVFRFQFD